VEWSCRELVKGSKAPRVVDPEKQDDLSLEQVSNALFCHPPHVWCCRFWRRIHSVQRNEE
jgi:hypothetical protein